MKKIITVCALTLICCAPSFAWGRIAHAAINKIAEDHLTKTAAAAVSNIMGGESIVTFASYPDDARDRLNANFKPDWNKAYKGYGHTYEVDENYWPYHGIDCNGRYVTNALYFIEGFEQDLRQAAERPDTANFIDLVMLCHFIADMHCPGHVRYQPKRDIANKFKVNYQGRGEIVYHGVWDDVYPEDLFPWSYSDYAAMCDIKSKSEIAGIIKGDIYDWGRETAIVSLPVRKDMHQGSVIDSNWKLDNADLLRSQIRNAGYRLAHELNMLFDAKYAKKHKK